MLGTEASDALPWRRRPRRPLPALLQDWRIWPALVILWLIAVFGGFAYAATDGVWWGRVLGAVSMLVGLTAAVRFALHVRRPVVDDRFDPDAPWVTAAMATWREELARTGRVEIDLSVRKVFWTASLIVVMLGGCLALALGLTGVVGRLIGVIGLVVFVPLGVIPHLEFATARGPALRVDTFGLRIARWRPVQVPWSELLVAGNFTTGRGSSVISQNATVYVTPEWYARYQQKGLHVRRVADRVATHYTKWETFSIPSTIDASAFPLSLWLDEEIERHNPLARASVRADDQPPG